MIRTDIQSLTDSDVGRYYVVTRHSTYDVDLDARTLSRVTASGNGLRADGHQVDLVTIARCEVGLSAVFYMTGLAEVGPTMRTTTPVISIEEVK